MNGYLSGNRLQQLPIKTELSATQYCVSYVVYDAHKNDKQILNSYYRILPRKDYKFVYACKSLCL